MTSLKKHREEQWNKTWALKKVHSCRYSQERGTSEGENNQLEKHKRNKLGNWHQDQKEKKKKVNFKKQKPRPIAIAMKIVPQSILKKLI